MDKKINFTRIITLMVLVPLLLLTNAQAAFPEYFDISKNYYTVYGSPDVSASILGGAEFSRGTTVTININLNNKGLITGFRSEQEANDEFEQSLQETEMRYEGQKTTAIGIVSTLVSLNPAIKVKSGPQEAGTLVSGQQTEEPVKFTIEIAKNARAGTYPLLLNLIYGYQENVQIDGRNTTDIGLTDLEVGLWYEIRSQNLTLPIVIKPQADFSIINVTGNLKAGKEGLLYVTYKNIGELPVKDATVRISVSDPFSTTDDQAFIGLLEPGESSTAIFKLKVDSTATSKMYGINSEIKYEDIDGHEQITDNIKISIETLPAGSASENLMKYAGIIIVIGFAIILVFGILKYKKKSGS
ncbi:MAG: hypothetical protein IBX40_05535 [Methanosarcinales archaeon]|nr:hypothetical protein [Methanosarcinales archaeon]